MQSLINISIDDVSPHPYSSTKVLENCNKIIKEFPDAKFTLFIPISYWRTIKKGVATSGPLQINLFPDFCKQISELPENNFEICYHGFYHGIPGKSDNDEFQYLDYDQAVKVLNAMFDVVKLANLQDKFKKIFRPPAWRMSPSAIKASRDLGIEILALSPKDYAQKVYDGEHLRKNDVVYYNCNPPFDPLKLYKNTEIVYHACEWDKNYLSDEKTFEIIEFLKSQENYKFSFIGELLESKSEVQL